MWKLKKRYWSSAIGHSVDPNRCNDIWKKIRTLLLQEPSEHRTKLHIYSELKTSRLSIPYYHSSIQFDDRVNTETDYGNLSFYEPLMKDESRAPPFENSILYEFVNNYEKDQISSLLERIVTTINPGTNRADFKGQREREVIDNGRKIVYLLTESFICSSVE